MFGDAISVGFYVVVNVDAADLPKKKFKSGDESGDKKLKKEEKATDDYHYERFKKLFKH